MEIFAPAGNFESLKQAVQSGADCVYLGLDSFNARMRADNFTVETLAQAVELCHLHGTKVFLTLNILVKPNEFDKALEVASQAYLCGVDGIICADFGLSSLLAQHLPDCDIVFSTQANVQNSEGCTVSKQLGINSLVLSREIDKKTVIDIRKNHPEINLEYFVQGALCVSVSGQCQMSSAVDAYSGNRGQCKQPCRQAYSCYFDGKKTNEGYLLSTKDLFLADKIDELKQLGINRIKIEGRNRRKEYVGQATEVYRKAIDGKTLTNDDITNLKKMFNRGDFTQGYMYEPDMGKIMYPYSQGHKGLEVGQIEVVKDKFCIATTKQKFKSGDAFKIFRNNIEVGNAVFAEEQKGKIKLSYSGKIKAGDKISVTTDSALLEQYAQLTKKVGVVLQIEAYENLPVKCTAICKGKTFTFESDFVCDIAQNNPTSSDEIAKQMSKLGDTQFTILDIVVKSGHIFLPKSKINEFRRNIFDQISKKLTHLDRTHPTFNKPQIDKTSCKNMVAVCISAPNQMPFAQNCDVVIVKPKEYTKQFLSQFEGKFYLDLPNFALKDDVELLKKLIAEIPNITGISANSLYAIDLAKQFDKKLFLNQGMNIFNDYTTNLWKDAHFAYSNELSINEISSFKNQNGFVYAEGYNVCMTLAHCPVQVNFKCTCKNCKYKGDLTYKDKLGNEFLIKRKRLSKCYFELLNGHRLSGFEKLTQNHNFYLNLCDLNEEKTKTIIDSYITFAKTGAKNSFGFAEKTTNGHLFKNVK